MSDDCAILASNLRGYANYGASAACCGVGFKDPITGRGVHAECNPAIWPAGSDIRALLKTGSITDIYFSGFEIEFYNKPFPSWLSKLTSLGVLFLNGTGLTGTLPDLPPNVYELHLEDNYLSGPLPASFSKDARITFLHLSNNYFTGTLDLSNANKDGNKDYGQNCFDKVIQPGATSGDAFTDTRDDCKGTIVVPPLSSAAAAPASTAADTNPTTAADVQSSSAAPQTDVPASTDVPGSASVAPAGSSTAATKPKQTSAPAVSKSVASSATGVASTAAKSSVYTSTTSTAGNASTAAKGSSATSKVKVFGGVVGLFVAGFAALFI